MNQKYLLIILFVLVIVGTSFIFKDDIKETLTDDPDTPPLSYDNEKIKVLSENFGDWNGRPDTEADWGSVAAQIRNYIGYNPNEETDGYGKVFGFFKGHNIGLGTGTSKNGWSIRVLREYVKEYVTKDSRTDNQVITGEFL